MCAWMYVPPACRSSQRSEETSSSLELQMVEPPWGCWELNRGLVYFCRQDLLLKQASLARRLVPGIPPSQLWSTRIPSDWLLCLPDIYVGSEDPDSGLKCLNGSTLSTESSPSPSFLCLLEISPNLLAHTCNLSI